MGNRLAHRHREAAGDTEPNRENEEVERQFVEYVQTIAPDIDEDTARDILTEYSERFSEYPWLEDEHIVLESQVDALIEEYVKGAK